MFDFPPQFELDATFKVLNVRLKAFRDNNTSRRQSGQVDSSCPAAPPSSFDVATQIVIEYIGTTRLYGATTAVLFNGSHGRAAVANEDPGSDSVETTAGVRTTGSDRNSHKFSCEHVIPTGDDKTADTSTSSETTDG